MSDAVVASGSVQSAGKKRRSWFEPGRPVSFSIAVERNNEDSDEHDMTELLLMPFTRQPIVDFGVVVTGKKKTRQLCVHNPQCFPQEVNAYEWFDLSVICVVYFSSVIGSRVGGTVDSLSPLPFTFCFSNSCYQVVLEHALFVIILNHIFENLLVLEKVHSSYCCHYPYY